MEVNHYLLLLTKTTTIILNAMFVWLLLWSHSALLSFYLYNLLRLFLTKKKKKKLVVN